MTAWTEAEPVRGEHVTFTWHYELEDTGEALESMSTLRFPAWSTVERTLEDTGFDVVETRGDWDGSALAAASPEWIFLTTR